MIGEIIMVHGDDRGLVIPPKVAPIKVAIIPIGKDEDILELCNSYKERLNRENISCYVDDSEKSPGFKFAEAEVNGIPVRIEVGRRDLENGVITLARRDTNEKITVGKDTDIVTSIKGLMDEIQANLYNKALERRDAMTYEAKSLEELEDIMNKHPGFVKAMWCGDPKCEERIKEIRGTKSRCIPFGDEKISDKCVCCGKDAKDLVIWGIQY